jgi:CrcB protein
MESALNCLALMTPVSLCRSIIVKEILIIGAGGFLGAVLRYVAVLSMQVFKTKHNIPLGTLLVNVVGCLLIGVLAVLAENSRILTPDTRNFLIVGILGAFTTFSTFGYESMTMLKNGLTTAFALNIGLQLALGFFAVWLGMNAGRLLQKVF